MTIPRLPSDWADTRSTLQAYGQALTAFPRAAGTADDRWTHVAMAVTSKGLVAAPTLLADGESLVTTINLVSHEVEIRVGDTVEVIDISSGLSRSALAQAVLVVAAAHGGGVEVDEDRISGDEVLPYLAEHAVQFHAAAEYAAEAFAELNSSLSGEITGPHLWPHGFDIASEWYSDKRVPHGESDASAQIAIGFYPANESYFYANPWPFEDSWAESPPVEGAKWHLDGWQGAVLDPAGLTSDGIIAFGRAVHDLASHTLSN